MGQYAHNLDNLEEEIFEIIPMSFFRNNLAETEKQLYFCTDLFINT